MNKALKKALEDENERYGEEMGALDNREDLYCDRHEIRYEGDYGIPVVHSQPSLRDLSTDLHMLKMEHEARKTEIRLKYLIKESNENE